MTFFIPFACSLAARIATEEAGLVAEFVEVTPGAVLADGRPLRAISPMGYVPALEDDDGFTLTEGPAVLTWLADRAPGGTLAPEPSTRERARLRQWLNFVATELHRGVFKALLSKAASADEKDAARGHIAAPFTVLSAHLDGRATLLERWSVADAYLLAVLNWCETSGVDLAAWPVLERWRAAARRRPSVARAMAAERPLLRAT